MAFSFSDEQEEFRSVLRRYFQDTSPTTEVRRLMDSETGWEREGWEKLNRDLGLAGVHVPEEFGGQGFGHVELGIVLEEMGRALVCAPYFATTAMAATALCDLGSEDDKRRLLPPIASGECIATLAIRDADGDWTPESATTTARDDGNGAFRLNGRKRFVLDGASADLILTVARTPGSSGADGLGLYAVAGDAAGLERTPLPVMDPTRRQADLAFENVAAAPVGTPGEAGPALSRVMDRIAVALASEMVGGAEILRESALDYTRMRMQFGRPIASFQAIKHKAADMLVDVELARSAAYYAADAAAGDADDLPAVASLAKACAADAYMQTAIHAIQLHGGIGFTWDNDTHLWFKRAKSSEVLFGTPDWHRERMMQRWEMPA